LFYTLADCGFLKHTKSAYIGGDNIGVGPAHFEWRLADPQTARFVTDELLPQARGRGQVAWILEPFFLHPHTYLNALEKDFDYVLTHDLNFVTNQENWLWYPAGGSWIAFDQWGVHEKTRNISMLLSAKKMTRGHRLRHEILEQYGSQLDAVLGLTHRVTPFEALADYRYSIIVENEKSRGWFTEKLIDCLSVGTIPIYWGDPDLTMRGFDGDGIFRFEDSDDLDDIMRWFARPGVAEREYTRRLPAIRANLETAKRFRVCEDYIFERYPFLFGSAA
jgi:hypothetical protein